MSVVSKDISKNEAKVTQLLNPQAISATTLTSTGLDTSLYKRGALIVSAGAYTDGTYQVQVETSATSGGSYAVQGSANTEYVSGAAPTDISSAGTASKVYVYDLNLDQLDNRWLKVNINESVNGTTGVLLAIHFVGELKSGA